MGTTDSGKWALDVISKNSVTVDYEYVGTARTIQKARST